MTTVFISYGRASEQKIRALAQDLESLGHQVWFDQELAGGQAWWEHVLAQIRECDVFLFALAPDSMQSQACKLEYTYAGDLGKIVLPVLVADGVAADLLPPALARIQFVDFRSQDKPALAALVRAFNALPPLQALPDPLPPAPAAPVSYLGTVSEQVDSPDRLSFEQQTALTLRLKQGMKDARDAANVRVLLQRFRARDDLFAKVADEIDELLKIHDRPAAATAHAAGAARPDGPGGQRDAQSAGPPPPFSRTVSAAPQAQTGGAAPELSSAAFTKYVLMAIAGVIAGYLVPALALETLNRSLRGSFTVFAVSIVLGLLPVWLWHIAVLRKGGRHALARRWAWCLPIGWVIGALAGSTVSSFHILVFGVMGGGLAVLVLILHTYVTGRSKAQHIEPVG